MTASPRLAALARPAPAPPRVEEVERCELCAEPIAAEHRHLLELDRRRLLCACRACSILFDRREAGGGRYRLVPDRSRIVADLDLDDASWSSFGIPVEMAFFFEDSAAGRVVAFYPSPAGATESLLGLGAWDDLCARNPVLAGLEPDVEALLVDRTGGEREHWLVPVDRCYALVGLIRTSWRGLSGGDELWRELDGFFAGLRRQADIVTRDGRKEAR